jgi:hypothetical protein
MDLVEHIETTRYLGAEFLVWLWFKAELFEGNFTRPSGAEIEVWLDSQLTLQSASDAHERIQLVGVAPSATPEAKLGLRFNKLPVRARVCLAFEGKQFSLLYDATTFSFGSVKLPALITEDGEERFLERMQLLELLDQLWNELYAEFLALRLSPHWERTLLPAVLAWARGQSTLSTKAYRALLP